MTEQIKTERLILRKLRIEDAQAIASLIGNLSVSRWLTRVPHPYNVEDARAFIRQSGDEAGVFTVTYEDKIIGGCSLEGELGYWLGEPYWGRGFATEAAGAMVDRFFKEHDEPVKSGYIQGNTASCRVLHKLGFADDKAQAQNCLSLGKTVQIQKMLLTKHAWQAAA